jgi:hypothetical protein
MSRLRALAVAVFLVGAPAALAGSSVSVDRDPPLIAVGGTGARDDLSVYASVRPGLDIEAGDGSIASRGCVQLRTWRVRCGARRIEELRVRTGGGRDFLLLNLGRYAHKIDAQVRGGPGGDGLTNTRTCRPAGQAPPHVRLLGGPQGDSLRGADGRDLLLGGNGDDELSGSSCDNDGDDFFSGGRGDDVLRGREGDDVLRGGPGTDRCAGGPGANRLFGCERMPGG